MIAAIQVRNCLIVLAFILGMVAVAAALLPLYWALCRKSMGWEALMHAFPPAAVHKTGKQFRADGYIGGGGRSSFTARGIVRPFLVEPAREGLLLTANFARTQPILIPWDRVQDVTDVELGSLCSDVMITVEYEGTLQFHTTNSALTALQHHLPAERFQKPAISGESPMALLKGIAELRKNQMK